MPSTVQATSRIEPGVAGWEVGMLPLCCFPSFKSHQLAFWRINVGLLSGDSRDSEVTTLPLYHFTNMPIVELTKSSTHIQSCRDLNLCKLYLVLVRPPTWAPLKKTLPGIPKRFLKQPLSTSNGQSLMQELLSTKPFYGPLLQYGISLDCNVMAIV